MRCARTQIHSTLMCKNPDSLYIVPNKHGTSNRGPSWTAVLFKGLLFRFHVSLGECKSTLHPPLVYNTSTLSCLLSTRSLPIINSKLTLQQLLPKTNPYALQRPAQHAHIKGFWIHPYSQTQIGAPYILHIYSSQIKIILPDIPSRYGLRRKPQFGSDFSVPKPLDHTLPGLSSSTKQRLFWLLGALCPEPW